MATLAPDLTGPFCPRFVTVCPGDIILTGTPAGVGVFRKPPLFLKVGWLKEGRAKDPEGLAGLAQAYVCQKTDSLTAHSVAEGR